MNVLGRDGGKSIQITIVRLKGTGAFSCKIFAKLG